MEATRTISWLAGCGSLLLAALSLLVARSIRRPLSDIAAVARSISRGDLSQHAKRESDDEIGDVALALSETKSSLERLATTERHVIEAARQGRLSARGSADELSGVFAELIAGMNEILATANAPLQETKEVLSRAGNRDLTARVRGSYAGDFDLIKVATNHALDTLERAPSGGPNGGRSGAVEHGGRAHDQQDQLLPRAPALRLPARACRKRRRPSVGRRRCSRYTTSRTQPVAP